MANVKIGLDRRKKYGTRYNLSLIIRYKDNGYKVKYISLGIRITATDLKNITGIGKYAEDWKEAQNKLERAKEWLKKSRYSKEINNYINQKSIDTGDLKGLFEMKIAQLEENNQTGSAEWYQRAWSKIELFGVPKLSEINLVWLHRFKTHLNTTLSPATTGGYLRCLRAICNIAIDEKLITEYPFRKFKIQTAESTNIALDDDQLKLVFQYEPVTKAEEKYLSLFKVAYLCHGAYMSDLFQFKKSNLKNGYLEYFRVKTRNTSNKPIKVVVVVSGYLMDIINSMPGKDEYLIDLNRIGKDQVKKCTYNTNVALRKIGSKLGFDFNLKMSIARHSFVNKLTEKGESTKNIANLVGHKNESTTANYQKTIKHRLTKELTKDILDFLD